RHGATINLKQGPKSNAQKYHPPLAPRKLRLGIEPLPGCDDVTMQPWNHYRFVISRPLGECATWSQRVPQKIKRTLAMARIVPEIRRDDFASFMKSPFRAMLTQTSNLLRRRGGGAAFLSRFGLLVLLGLGGLSCNREQIYQVNGIVREVLPKSKQVKIEHEKIPNYMEAMTMHFNVKDDKEIAGLEPGDKVSFRMV